MLLIPLVLVAVGCRDRYEGQAGATSSPTASPYAASPTASPYAGESPSAYGSPTASPGTGSAMAGPSVSAVVVSVDRDGRSITVHEAKGSHKSHKLTVSDDAVSTLTDIKAGDRVTVTCETSAGTTGTTGSTESRSSASGQLANCTRVTSVTKETGATGR
jgi:hypothetical protein